MIRETYTKIIRSLAIFRRKLVSFSYTFADFWLQIEIGLLLEFGKEFMIKIYSPVQLSRHMKTL